MVPDARTLSNNEYSSWLLQKIGPVISQIIEDAETQVKKELSQREETIRTLFKKLAEDRVLYEEDLAAALR